MPFFVARACAVFWGADGRRTQGRQPLNVPAHRDAATRHDVASHHEQIFGPLTV